MKIKYTFLLIFFVSICNFNKAQVLISRSTDTNLTLDPSAILEVRDTKTGVLFPQVALLSGTDATTVNSPVNGLLLYNTTTARYNFWQGNQWNKNFEIEDGLAVIKITKNYPSNSTNSVTISTFPSSVPIFTLNSDTTGWTSLGSDTSIIVAKASNTNFIIAEGMSQINNTTTNQQYQYAIGIFVDGKLKIVRKYFADSKGYTCMWNKFSVSGVFNDLTVGTHTVSVYAYNLPRSSSTSYTGITYGGNSSTCSNLNNDMGRVFVTAQITQ